MRLILFECRKFFARNLLKTLFIILQCFICLLVSCVLISNGILASNYTNEFAEQFADKEYYILTSTDEAQVQEYLNTEEGIHKLRDFTNKMKEENYYFDFFSAYVAPLAVESTSFHHVSSEFENENVSFSSESTMRALNCMQVSRNVFDLFNLQIQKGEGFSEEDYILTEEKSVPVLLGDAYHDIFEVGDTFTAAHGGLNMTFHVKGILKGNALFLSGGSFYNLDHHIILPAFETFHVKDTEYKRYEAMRLIEFAEGEIVSNQKELNLTEIINEIEKEVSIDLHFQINPIISSNSQELKLLSKDVSNSFTLLGIFVMITSLFSMMFALYTCIRSEASNIGIQYLCGASDKYVKRLLSLEVFFLLLVPAIMASVLVYLVHELTQKPIYYFFIPISAIIVFILLHIFVRILLKRSSMNQMIRGEYSA